MTVAPSVAGSWRRIVIVLVLLGISAAAVFWGLRIRRYAWDYSQGAHFKGDVNNAFHWGRLADEYGLFRLYDADEAANPLPIKGQGGIAFTLAGNKTDYPPLRLTIAQTWYRWAHRQYPQADEWQDDYDFTAPMLWANTAAEGVSAALVFVIIRMWRKRDTGFSAPGNSWKSVWRADLPAMFGALLLWFNPAVIWEGHCWPQWDIWPVPFILGAVLLTSLNLWMTAGICLAIGASVKGQLLLGAPVFLFWPMFRSHFGDALRLAGGFLITTALIALPWMHPSGAGILWMVMIAVAGVWLSPVCAKWRPKDWRINAGLVVVAALLAWPWGAGAALALRLFALLIAGACAAMRFLPRRLWISGFAVLGATVIFLLMPFFGASAAWYRLGVEYGTEKFDFMVTGSGAYNIPRMLVVYDQWPRRVADPVKLPLIKNPVTFTTMTRIVDAIAIWLCAAGAALQDRRRDVRFLAAMVAPWLLCFLILTQMHGRYTIWAAAMSALLAGTGFGMALLGIIVSLVSWMGIAHNQLLFAPQWSPDTLALMRRLDPAPGFLLLLIAAILLYTALAPRRRLTDG